MIIVIAFTTQEGLNCKLIFSNNFQFKKKNYIIIYHILKNILLFPVEMVTLDPRLELCKLSQSLSLKFGLLIMGF